MESKNYSRNNYDFFELDFKNREDFISYLKTAKTSLAFRRLSEQKLASQRDDNKNVNNETWYGTDTFNEALDLFEYGWYEDFDLFLSQKKKIDKYFPYVSRKKVYQENVCGSVPVVVNAINNLPLNMRKVYETKNTNAITINYNCSYPWYTTRSQIFNNGLLTLALIDFFDSLGYRVDLNFFNIGTAWNQVLYEKVTLKSPGEKINLQKFYFAFCNQSFLRRLLLRVTETVPGLDVGWTFWYGSCMKIEEIKDILNIGDNSILINWPKQMGVNGEDIEEDVRNFLDVINLGEYIKFDNNQYNICDDRHVIRSIRR